MKKHLVVLKWQLSHMRSFSASFVIVIVLGIALSICSVGIAVLSKHLIDFASEKKWPTSLNIFLLFAFLVFLQVILQSAISILASNMSELLSNKIRLNSFAFASRSKWLDISKYHSGDILTRLTSDASVVATSLTNALPNIISLVFRLLAAFIALAAFDPILAVLAFSLGPVTILISRYWTKKLKQYHIKVQESESLYRSFLNDCIQNLITVKSFCMEKICADKIDTLQSGRLYWAFKRKRLESFSGSILSSGYWLGYLLAFTWGVSGISNGSATFGTIAAFLQLIDHIQAPFTELAYTLPQIISAEASSERLMELEKIEKEEFAGSPLSWDSSGIHIDGVSFSYEKGKPLLDNISIKINHGETIGIIGASGSGKTTLLRLILSFVSSPEGHIYFTGSQGEKVEAGPAARSLVSYVPQGNTLFSGTIADNLRFASPNATENELLKAVKAANAWEFIKEYPKGFDTIIGEKGMGLSAGQSQRLAIARALCRKAPILILDEATSDLDSDTEKCIIKNLHNLQPKPTCIIITHRLAALEICNRVLKLENGGILDVT